MCLDYNTRFLSLTDQAISNRFKSILRLFKHVTA